MVVLRLLEELALINDIKFSDDLIIECLKSN